MVRATEQGGMMSRWNTGDIQVSETILNATVMIETRHYAFAKTHRTVCTTRGVKLDVN